MRTIEHTSFDEPIQCVERHLCADVPYCHDSESVSEVSLDSDSRNPSIKRNAISNNSQLILVMTFHGKNFNQEL
ncbi:hypothetical protein B5X24_HaOG213176 [Helicoverpa armigera]|uniref:Uncharacterized protein n=1 Tax=Helicoverpa armigera TaxID=29058 RepID=A0A2W1BE17_HELAM|nr:hypothetical protein B5X24_HaOG213176 [Helicoverpa armigera]